MKKILLFCTCILVQLGELNAQATLPEASSANGWEETAKILASDGSVDDFFGGSVSTNGNYAIVGAIGDNDNGSYTGSAYIYERSGNNWTQQAKLTALDGAEFDEFGTSVSISGDYAIVGASRDNDNGISSGSAYIFERTGSSWTQQAKLTALDGEAVDGFGSSVSISGNYAIVGTPNDDDNGSNSGSAYIFHHSGGSWSQQAKLTASDGAESDYFAGSVSITADYAIVGALFDDDNGTSSGSAYIFARSGNSWTQQAKLTASDAAEGDNFGGSVSISGNYAIVGARWDDDNGSNSGSAYIFERSGSNWTQQAKLTALDGTADDWFGWSVSIMGNYGIVGAWRDDDNGSDSGSAYIFERNGSNWMQQTKLTASDAAEFDQFGWSVSISGDCAIVGVVGNDDNGPDSGSAYIFEQVSLSTNDRFDLSSLTLYPNPTTFSITIENPQFIPIDKISVYDLTGRLVFVINTNGNTSNQIIHVGDLAAAVYNVVIQSDRKQTIKRLVRK